MNRRDLFRFARKGDLFVPESANPPDNISADCKGRSQVGYSRRFFMGALAAGIASTGASETWPLTDAPCVLTGNWRVVEVSYTTPTGDYTETWQIAEPVEVQRGVYATKPGAVKLSEKWTLLDPIDSPVIDKPRTWAYPPTAHLPWNPRT